MIPVALTIAGSDPSGGAGIQADLKTFHQFRVYGTAALTLLTVQNTNRVSQVEMISPALVGAQIEAVMEDLPVAAAKTGALGSAEIIITVSELAASFRFPLIVDPVMISKHGAALITPEAQKFMRTRLIPCAALATPNIPEAEILTGMRIQNRMDMERAAGEFLKLGCKAILLKGGHLSDPAADDYFASANRCEWITGRRVDTRHTHGTGCTYSAAITAALASGDDLITGVRKAKHFVQQAVETAPGLGAGHGPLNHWAE